MTFPLATALRETLHKGYTRHDLRHDLMAGFIVSLVALPLAMALSIAVGLPPQHGLYTAIVAGAIAAFFGGSTTQVSGPTAAFVVIVAPIAAEYGLHGLIWCQIVAGLMLLSLGFAKLGRYIHYVPYPVIVGFIAGIAVVIATLSLNDLMGLGIESPEESYIEKVSQIFTAVSGLDPYELTIGLATLAAMIVSAKFLKTIPAPLAGIAVGTLLTLALATAIDADIETIGKHFSFTLPDGSTGHGIPPGLPAFHMPGADSLLRYPDPEELRVFMLPAMVIAALAALESLLSAKVADSMTGTRHDPNAELNGIGLANIVSAFFAGIPATGAIARTATNIQNGARSPLASLFHALLLLAYMLAFAPLVSYIPMASLAALLLMVAWRMSHLKQFTRIMRLGTVNDRVVLLSCFLLTVLIDMVAGVVAGITLSCLLLMKQITAASPPESRDEGLIPGNIEVPPHVLVYHVDGPLFFGTAEQALERYSFVHDGIKTVIFDLERVPFIDMSGLVAMKALLSGLARRERKLILCGKPEVVQAIMRKIDSEIPKDAVEARPSLSQALAAL